MSKIANFLRTMWDGILGWTATGIGTGISTIGIIVKELAVVLIMLGVLLWMFRITKVFRWGAAAYLIGLILEILGLLMIV